MSGVGGGGGQVSALSGEGLDLAWVVGRAQTWSGKGPDREWGGLRP